MAPERHEHLPLFEPVVGTMWGVDRGPIRMSLEAEFRVGDRLFAAAVQTGVMASLDDGRPMRLPADFRELLRPAHVVA